MTRPRYAPRRPSTDRRVRPWGAVPRTPHGGPAMLRGRPHADDVFDLAESGDL